jgi:hypothetical protein
MVGLSLDDVLGAPDRDARLAQLSPDEATALLCQARAVESLLLERVLSRRAPPAAAPAKEPDQMLTPEAVAELLGVTKRRVYALARKWRFVVRPSRKVLRISAAGLRDWQRAQRG